jgi:hypothetical protein
LPKFLTVVANDGSLRGSSNRQYSFLSTGKMLALNQGES